ncbi:hypothetical protein [Photorhabdus hindustanensis]|uniref:Regulator of chromosome condensation (RCC1) repeat-containing protein n=1 Tax=Photorhabdus hindustanensis TaxID=2918802 RepID=A0A2S8Q0Y9_9GAMM|nr:hypothetical protein [Photorhabdus hindustanensis]PQQ25397.1 hypothetical protein C6H66_12845 [Photorhabdus hindustanensis]
MNQPNNFSPDINTDNSFIKQHCKSARYSNYSNNDHYNYIVTNDRVTAMLLQNGSVTAWENPFSSWDVNNLGSQIPPEIIVLRDIISLSATSTAFAALRANHSVVAWGDENYGGQIPPEIAQLQDIVNLSSTRGAFAALREDHSVVSWGDLYSGGRMPSDIAKLKDIISLGATQLTFIAIRENGKRVAWGGGDTRAHGDYD